MTMPEGQLCSQCGRQFVCDLVAGKDKCWCQDYPAALSVKPNENCLCPSCLKVAVQEVNK